MEQAALTFAPADRLEDATPTGDPAALHRLRRWGGMTLVQELVQLFLSLSPERIRTVRTGVVLSDAPAAEAAAHSLGSSCGQLGALRMQRLSMRVERLAGGGELDAVRPLVEELEEELARVRGWLEVNADRLERVA